MVVQKMSFTMVESNDHLKQIQEYAWAKGKKSLNLTAGF